MEAEADAVAMLVMTDEIAEAVDEASDESLSILP